MASTDSGVGASAKFRGALGGPGHAPGRAERSMRTITTRGSGNGSPVDRGFDRDEILEQASRARSRAAVAPRGRAVSRGARASSPTASRSTNGSLPLLAITRQEFDAWNSYRAIAHAALREGREDRGIAIFREATRALPQEIQAWQGLARLLVRQSELDAAVEVLLEGSRQFRSHFLRPHAIHLLRRARAVDPWHFEAVLELADSPRPRRSTGRGLDAARGVGRALPGAAATPRSRGGAAPSRRARVH